MPSKRVRRQKKIGEARGVYPAEEQSSLVQSRAKQDKLLLKDWEWVQANRPKLEKEHAGRWIAVAGRQIVGTGARLSTAMRQARKAGFERPFVTGFKAAEYQDMLEVPHWL